MAEYNPHVPPVEPTEVPCPTCGVSVGAECIARGPRDREFPHPERLEIAASWPKTRNWEEFRKGLQRADG